MREPNFPEVFDSGDEFLLHGAGEERGVLLNGGYANALEEVEGGAEAGLDAAGEEPRTAVDDTAEIGTLDAGLAEEEGKDGDEGGDLGG